MLNKIKGNLLLVDDEDEILKNIKAILEDEADEIFTAKDGLEALSILMTQTIDCVVCDIRMPKMDGVEVLRDLRQNDIKTPLIFYTGHGDKELEQKALKLGAFEFVDKTDLQSLITLVKTGLNVGVKLRDNDLEGIKAISTFENRPEFIDSYKKILKK